MTTAKNSIIVSTGEHFHQLLAYRLHLTGTPRHLSIAGGNHDFIHFMEESESDDIKANIKSPWKILITDDDQIVHDSTVLALNGVTIQNRPLEFLHAYSAKEGHELLKAHPEVALILLDVVMETVDAGFRLVDIIRDELHLKDLRIVIRTGQPGTATKLKESQCAGIDAYTIKSKVTRSMLVNLLEKLLPPIN